MKYKYLSLSLVLLLWVSTFYVGYKTGKGNDKQMIKTDYQFNIHNDSLWLYSGNRYVGKAIDTSWTSPLYELLKKDNE